jgi:hypothetical protein
MNRRHWSLLSPKSLVEANDIEQIFYFSQSVASVGVIASLGFIAVQIRANTAALQRSQHNSTMAQWTVIRMAVAQNRDVAELMAAGLRGESALDAADQLRLEQLLQENAWAAFHIWDRTQRGILPKGTFELTGGAALRDLLGTPRGGAWWSRAKHVGFVPGYVLDVDAMLGKETDVSVAGGQRPQAGPAGGVASDRR